MAKRKKHPEEQELELTTLLNIMVVLVSFLLLSAIFSKITIQELNMPTQAGGSSAPSNVPPPVVIEVIVRKDALEISNGKTVTDRLPKLDDKYDTANLSQKLKLLKDKDMTKKDVVLLVEPEVDYSTMIGVMDALKFVEVPSRQGSKPLRITLFPNVTVGDAP
jgi:biopolymer transport protein ExbD